MNQIVVQPTVQRATPPNLQAARHLSGQAEVGLHRFNEVTYSTLDKKLIDKKLDESGIAAKTLTGEKLEID